MGIFSKSPKDPGSEQDGSVGVGEAALDMRPPADMRQDGAASNVETISPLALKLQERQRKLDSLKARIGTLNRAFEQISALTSESGNSVGALIEFIEASKSNLETEIRLKSENAKLSTNVMDLSYQVESLTTQLQESDAQVHALRKRGTETRTALEEARNDIISIRENNKKVNEEYRAQSAKLVDANSRLAEVTDSHADLQAKFRSLEEHSESVKAELEALSKRESELQQNLSESSALLEEEIRKNQKITNDLEAIKRELTETRNSNIDLKSKLDVASHELEFNKSRFEEEQRKHDNEVYSLNSEIENLSSQRRIGAQTLKDVTDENKKLKERNRDLIARLQEIEHLLDAAQKNHDSDRTELLGANAKLRELNLRYNSTLTDLNHEKKQNQRYAENIEELVEENKKLQQYRIKFGTAEDQIVELKSLISSYQMAMEEATAGFERGSSDPADEPAEPQDDVSVEEGYAPGAEHDETQPDDSSVVVKLRD
ncbi:MAG: hypothetical protein AAGL24_04805 [Pseudomonadota bacterium]